MDKDKNSPAPQLDGPFMEDESPTKFGDSDSSSPPPGVVDVDADEQIDSQPKVLMFINVKILPFRKSKSVKLVAKKHGSLPTQTTKRWIQNSLVVNIIVV